MENIILLHGALGAAIDLQPLATVLARNGFMTHTFSFSGHGKTAFQNEFGIEQFSNELENYIHLSNIKQPVVFGYSMGGFVALHLAARQPALIRKIITLGTKFNWSREAMEKETRLLNPSVMLEKVPAFARALQDKHGAEWQTIVSKTAALMKEISEKQFLSPEILKIISVPVMLGLGDRDQMVTPEETISVYKTLPVASLCVLPDTKHQIENVNVELLSNAVTNFINQA